MLTAKTLAQSVIQIYPLKERNRLFEKQLFLFHPTVNKFFP